MDFERGDSERSVSFRRHSMDKSGYAVIVASEDSHFGADSAELIQRNNATTVRKIIPRSETRFRLRAYWAERRSLSGRILVT